uniref:hypothetical protein n=1 Tax=Saccharothrix espanaensis TaxID=103731 RepID=UPI003F491092
MGREKLADERARHAVETLADSVRDGFSEEVLARLWAAEQVRRAVERQIDTLLAQARAARPADGRRQHTWEDLGALMGISPQGARQRALRRRTPLDPLADQT